MSTYSQVDPLEREADVVKEMYELIDKFKVPTPPEDIAVYQTLRPTINTTRNSVDKALGDRDQNIDKFCKTLGKDIEELNREVREVKQEAQVRSTTASADSTCAAAPTHSTHVTYACARRARSFWT